MYANSGYPLVKPDPTNFSLRIAGTGSVGEGLKTEIGSAPAMSFPILFPNHRSKI